MDGNPLKDLAEQFKEQNREKRLQKVEADIQILKGFTMFKEIEIYQDTTTEKITINPKQITYVEDGIDDHAIVHMVDGSILYTPLSRNEVWQLFDEPINTYIKG